MEKTQYCKQLSEPDLLMKTPNEFKQNMMKRIPSCATHGCVKGSGVGRSRLNMVEEEKSGWSSIRGSQVSVDDDVLISILENELKEFVLKKQQFNLRDHLDKLRVSIKDPAQTPTSKDLKLQICSGNFMFNRLMNYGD